MVKKLDDLLKEVDGEEFEFMPVSVKMSSGETVLMLAANLDTEHYLCVDPLQSVVYDENAALKPWNSYTSDKFFVIHHRDVLTMNAMSAEMYSTYKEVLSVLYEGDVPDFSCGDEIADMYDDLFDTHATTATLQ